MIYLIKNILKLTFQHGFNIKIDIYIYELYYTLNLHNLSVYFIFKSNLNSK